MKKIFYIAILLLFLSCSSDDKLKDVPVAFDSHILVNGSEFETINAFRYSSVYEDMIYIQFVVDNFVHCGPCPTPPQYERIILNITCTVSELESTFDFSLPMSETRNINGGYFQSGFPIGFYSGTVKVSKINAERYKIEFKSIKGKFFLGNNNETDFEGYFEGDFKEIDNPLQQ